MGEHDFAVVEQSLNNTSLGLFWINHVQDFQTRPTGMLGHYNKQKPELLSGRRMLICRRSQGGEDAVDSSRFLQYCAGSQASQGQQQLGR